MGFVKKMIGYGCIGPTYVCIKKVVKSNSIIGSGFYSTLGGFFGTGAYKFLREDEVAERLEKLLESEEPELADNIAAVLSRKLPRYERNAPTRDSDPMQELKRQLMRERYGR